MNLYSFCYLISQAIIFKVISAKPTNSERREFNMYINNNYKKLKKSQSSEHSIASNFYLKSLRTELH